MSAINIPPVVFMKRGQYSDDIIDGIIYTTIDTVFKKYQKLIVGLNCMEIFTKEELLDLISRKDLYSKYIDIGDFGDEDYYICILEFDYNNIIV